VDHPGFRIADQPAVIGHRDGRPALADGFQPHPQRPAVRQGFDELAGDGFDVGHG
jgi:hypothetical protein